MEMDITRTVILIGACCANVNVDSNVENICSTAVCGRKTGKMEKPKIHEICVRLISYLGKSV